MGRPDQAQMNGSASDREAIHAELERARAVFTSMVSTAGPADLRRSTVGTRWTNQQLLFHMLFGYLIVRTLLPLVRAFGRLPAGYSRVFAAALNAGRRPFHVVNYLGSCGGAVVFRGPRLVAKLDRTVASLHRQLDRETDAALGRHYGTQHFDHHARQLTSPGVPGSGRSPGSG